MSLSLEDFEIIQKLGDIDGVSMFACLHYDNNLYVMRTSYKNNEKLKFIKDMQNYDFIPKIFTFFENGNIEYVVTEYVVGTTLEDWRKANNDKESIDSIFNQLCNMLKELHNLGYSNMNLTFENILITPTNKIKFMNFANEDFRCKPLKNTGNVDYWHLGIILFYLVTGQLPYEARNEKVLRMRMSSKIKYKKYDIDPKYLNIIKNLLKKNPEKRTFSY